MSIFSKIKVKSPKRSAHNLSYGNRLSCELGQLVPIYLEKVYPGDKIKHQQRINSNVATLSSQLMQEFDIRTEYFFVPTRLLWDNFENFLKGGPDGKQTYLHPFMDLQEFYRIGNPGAAGEEMAGTIFDYLGIPWMEPTTNQGQIINQELNVDILPFFAYMKVFKDYYADENLQDIVFNPSADGRQTLMSDLATEWATCLTPLSVQNLLPSQKEYWLPLFRNYKKDYFTSALPFAQKGDVITIPIDGVGDVSFTLRNAQGTPIASSGVDVQMRSNGVADDGELYPSGLASYEITARAHNVQATTTVDDFRTAMRVQEWLELNARSGTRANEMIFSHFGRRSQDARMQRAEFIQGNLQVYNVGNVYTTNQDVSNNGIPGQRYSVVNSSGISAPFKFTAPEWGYVIGIMTCYPVAAYKDGIRRQFLELDRFDYMWPEFANLGEQQIYNCEVKCSQQWPNGQGRPHLPLDHWGYTPRYSHYKTHPSEIHGQFKGTLNMFHDARDFANVVPVLDADFISINPVYSNLNRIFNVNAFGSQFQHWYFDVYHDVKMIRPLPYYDTPRIL